MIDVEAWIPHRPPFRFVDRVDALTTDPPTLVARGSVDPRWVVAGRVPPTLVIEALAQASRLLGGLAGGSAGGGLLGGLTAEILGPVPAGSALELRVTELRVVGTATRSVASAWVDGVEVVRATFVATVSADRRPVRRPTPR